MIYDLCMCVVHSLAFRGDPGQKRRLCKCPDKCNCPTYWGMIFIKSPHIVPCIWGTATHKVNMPSDWSTMTVTKSEACARWHQQNNVIQSDGHRSWVLIFLQFQCIKGVKLVFRKFVTGKTFSHRTLGYITISKSLFLFKGKSVVSLLSAINYMYHNTVEPWYNKVPVITRVFLRSQQNYCNLYDWIKTLV